MNAGKVTSEVYRRRGVARWSRPVLVTGMPRSGTTWLARELAESPGTAFPGREPMNPRGRQYALGGTVDGWVRLTDLTRKQQLILRHAFGGWNPMVYSRYGRRQWLAPLPWIRVIVKDPFSMPSLSVVSAATRAQTVVVYRHPAAVLASYRRMGWAPQPEEMRQIERFAPATIGPPPELDNDLRVVGRMWIVLHSILIADLPTLKDTLVVSHEQLASGGPAAVDRLRNQLGLASPRRYLGASAKAAPRTPTNTDPTKLHNLDRDPKAVAGAWRETIPPRELAELEDMIGGLLTELDHRKFDVSRRGEGD